MCPRFHYCPDGSKAPVPCPNGYTTLVEGSRYLTDCLPCKRGEYCKYADYFVANPYKIGMDVVAVTNKALYNGKCQKGYICLEGSSTSTPSNIKIGYICPKGSYCLEGAYIERKCAPGSY